METLNNETIHKESIPDRLKNVRRKGEINALKNYIDNSIFIITTETFNNIKNSYNYTRLKKAVEENKYNLKKIELALAELQTIESVNK